MCHKESIYRPALHVATCQWEAGNSNLSQTNHVFAERAVGRNLALGGGNDFLSITDLNTLAMALTQRHLAATAPSGEITALALTCWRPGMTRDFLQ